MTDWYAPNQQAVRPDGSGPAEEGTGGSTGRPEPKRDKAKDDDKARDKGEEEAQRRDDVRHRRGAG